MTTELVGDFQESMLGQDEYGGSPLDVQFLDIGRLKVSVTCLEGGYKRRCDSRTLQFEIRTLSTQDLIRL